MNAELLKKLGNIDQVAGIREARLLRGRGEGIEVAEFYNAAGLRFSVVPDRCMDLFDFSYRGVNLSFQSKNGLTSPQAFSPADGEFSEQWPGGMLVTCGLGNVGGHSGGDGVYPTHGRISHVPAKNFGTETHWEGDRYVLRATGEVHQTKLYGRHLSIRRVIETGLFDKTVRIQDTITNFEAEEEPYMLLYHFNFGYPLLQADSRVAASRADVSPMNELSTDAAYMMDPVDGRGEELYFRTNLGDRACCVLYNERLELGAYVAFDTKNLPNFLQWKNMKSHDYVLAIEPCNTCGLNRQEAQEQGKIATLPAYSSIENRLELGVLDGLSEIREWIRNLQ
ncbi:MAG: DUF4432 family protein [Oscillospiraceae bacterium]|nr:DUF4432 family protein [Oscillospiraceae bacterium]